MPQAPANGEHNAKKLAKEARREEQIEHQDAQVQMYSTVILADICILGIADTVILYDSYLPR